MGYCSSNVHLQISLLCLLLVLAHSEVTTIRPPAQVLDTSDILSRDVSVTTNGPPGTPLCRKFANTARLDIRALPKPDDGVPSGKIFVRNKACSAGSHFDFRDEVRPTGRNESRNGYTLALEFLSGTFKLPQSGVDVGENPENVKIAVADLRDGDKVPVCDGLQLRAFFLVMVVDDFTLPEIAQARPDSEKRVTLRPGNLYVVANMFAREGRDDSRLLTPWEEDNSETPGLICLFGGANVDQKGEAVTSEGSGGDEEGAKGGSGSTAIGIGAGVAGSVLGIVIITVAAIAWRRRNSAPRVTERQLGDDFSAASSTEMAPV